MGTDKVNRKTSLRRKIFQSLLWTTFFALMLAGTFWAIEEVNDFKKGVRLLKETYSENKKSEIKNDILEIKDWIYWVRSHPVDAISKVFTDHINRITPIETKEGYISKDIVQKIYDSIGISDIQFFIINGKNSIIYSSPGKDKSTALNGENLLALFRLIRSKNLKGDFSVPRYLKTESGDSILNSVFYFNSRIIPGYMFTTVIYRRSVDKILQEYCLDSLNRIRYAKNEYVFINTYEGNALASNGKINQPPVDILNTGDTAWISIFRVEQSAEAHPSGFFYSYPFKKITDSIKSLKTSFFSYLPEWRWIIGTGFYQDDVISVVEQKREELYSVMRKRLLKIAPFLLISVLLSYIIVMFFSRRLAKNIEIFKNFFTKIAGEHVFIDISQVSYKEFEILAENANIMVDKSIKAETAIRLSEERYRLLFEHNPASMLIYERNSYKLLAVNEAFLDQYGYTEEEIRVMHLPDLYPEAEKEAIVQFAQALHGHVHTGEWHHIKNDGSVITILVSSHDLVFMEQDARIAVITDISDRKLAEEKIRVSEKQLSLIYSNVFDAIYYLSVEPDNRFRFISVNQTFLILTGLAENQIVNKLVDEIIPEPSLTMVTENYKKAIQEKRTIQWDEISVYPTGEKNGLVSITPLFDSNERCINLVGTVHDITERKYAEEELKLHRDHLEELVIQRTAELEIEKEHAQSADRLKSAFLATMSHELRTPLNSIIGFTGILMQERPGPLNDEQKKQLGMAQNSARHLLSLINDVLDISKIEAGQLKMNFQKFNLPELIYKVVETNRPFAEKKNLSILVSVEENIKDITSDVLRVQQILLNLVNNAVKFTEIGTIRISCFSEGKFIKIMIKDSGIGIEHDKIEQLFKPFMQVDTGLTRKHEGTGLGLSICKKLTELLSGKIEVESEYGSGSTFTITLPII
jgi:PAS domain S-box-containing protein